MSNKLCNLDQTKQIAVFGCGYWGKNLVRNFYHLNALHSVCDTTDSGRATAASIAPNCRIVADITPILANPEIRGVVIATPAETHFALARQALLAGKDVLVEKPLALTFEQGAELVRLAVDMNRILMVGHVLEYHPGIMQLHNLIEHGELGKLQYIYSNRLSLGKVRREENILWSFAPHDIAVILRLLGSMPFEVIACGGAYVQPNIADVTVTHLLFDNGVRAHIYVSWLHPFKEQRLVVIGSRKMASFDDVHKRLTLYDKRVEWQEGQPIPIHGDGIEVPYPQDEPLRLECEAFLAAITTRNPPITDGQSGLRVLRVLQAAQRSLITNGQPVHLPMDPALENYH
ncbi:Gfo/Idh/MocA family protein [Chloroflexus aggregans]|uniref:Oxidoreductase domain protein n=1 Tax=Chloroflexus aggregans (strain MD-66 / DSM 9485) TaxID=326427 RepID=B8GBQ7_CHLAD|nr:Gfo/Idh/MocA family oxidoreductase [Chloroflexus aggregans]ACL24874.1 oxidoreductase domain protein [Chloroflexus aggregans DSM 9485]